MVFEGFTFAQWAAFLLVLLRISALLATLPFFGSPNLPPTLKAFLALALTLFYHGLVKVDPAALPTDAWNMAILAIGEVMIGAIMGFYVRLILTAVQIMGQLVGFQMGFAVANVVDPMGGGQVSILAQFCYLMSILAMFSVGGHHWFFKAMADSFILVPPGDFSLSKNLFNQVIHMSGEMFSLAIRLGAPLIGALLFTQVIMGILAKTVPQMNILIVGFPITISIGFIFLSFTLTLIIPAMARIFENLGPVLAGLMKAM